MIVFLLNSRFYHFQIGSAMELLLFETTKKINSFQLILKLFTGLTIPVLGDPLRSEFVNDVCAVTGPFPPSLTHSITESCPIKLSSDKAKAIYAAPSANVLICQ